MKITRRQVVSARHHGAFRPSISMVPFSPFFLNAPCDRPDEAEGKQLIHKSVQLRLWQRESGFFLDNQGLCRHDGKSGEGLEVTTRLLYI